MRTLAYGVVVLVLAVGRGVVVVDEPSAGATSPQQQVAPQEKASVEQPPAAQLTIVRSGPEPAPAVAPFDAQQAKRHQEAWAKNLGVPVELTNSIGMKLVLIPAGEFMMGSEEPAEETARAIQQDLERRFKGGLGGVPVAGLVRAAQFVHEHPQHRVRLTKPYYLGVYEVTQVQYDRATARTPLWQQVIEYPTATTWDDAVEFCNRLSALSEEKVAGRTYRLPTEAEWEYACRAGSVTGHSAGDNADCPPDHASLPENASKTAHSVGVDHPNAWGLHNMLGTKAQWCADWYAEDYYASSPVDDPQGPATGSLRVTRGSTGFRPASRVGFQPSALRTRFRVAAVVTAKVEPGVTPR